MVHKFDPKNAAKLENPERLVEMPPQRLIELLELSGSETILDFGAGTGMYSLPIADAVPDGELIAVDEQPELLEMLRDKLAANTPAGRVSIVANTDGRVPLDDAVAQRIFMINVFHHIHGDPAALAEVMRLLAPGGILLAAEFAQMERPFGPPNDHVLPLGELRSALTLLGLHERGVYPPGEVGLYHNVVVAAKPQA
ncbi:MAG: class I SAM-dependent methyltransferase [Thermoleophilia bacterium]